MARSTADATRFTATGPYADGMGTSKSAALDFAEPAPPNETPQQKVARLRKAAQRAREARTTRYDRLVLKGRRWADGAHRATVYTLVAATGPYPPNGCISSGWPC